jgi:hypothetical protein
MLPLLNRYDVLACLSVDRHALAVVSDAERYIYVVGGWEDGSRCSTYIERYDILAREWIKLASLMPTPR